MSVLLHRRSAPGGVHRDALDAGALERADRAARERARFLEPAGVQGEGATASLLGRRDDVASFSGEDAHGRLVHARKNEALHAAGQQADGQTSRAHGRRTRGD